MHEDYMVRRPPPPKLDPVVERVRADLHQRSQLGLQKYGTTLADNTSSQYERLRHAYEEALDLANYLMWSMMVIERQQGGGI